MSYVTMQTRQKEEWKDIKGFEGLYQVSNLGQIKSLYFTSNKTKKKYRRDKILKQQKDKQGYMTIRLSYFGKDKTYKTHRLVAKTFIPNIENKLEINHIDGNKANNIVSNLEWTTRSENQKHAYKYGLQTQTEKMKRHSVEMGKTYGKINGSKTGKDNIKKAIEAKKIKVNQYSLNGRLLKTWDSMSEAARNTGAYKSNISYCIKRKKGSAGGYKWEIA